MPIPNSVQYSDLDIKFLSHPVTKKLSVLNNERAVSQAIKNIVLTDRYERVYKPLLGASIRSKLFENFGPNIAYEIKEDIQIALRNYEPRVKIIDIKVDEKPEENAILMSITFFIRNQADPITTSILVERVR